MATLDRRIRYNFQLHEEDIDLQGPASYEGPWFDWTGPQRQPETDISTLATSTWEGI